MLDEELPQILDSFKHFGNAKKPYRPKLSIIICWCSFFLPFVNKGLIVIQSKRHHTRPLSTKSEFADKNGNTLPGTVVSKGVTGVYVPLASSPSVFIPHLCIYTASTLISSSKHMLLLRVRPNRPITWLYTTRTTCLRMT